MDRGKKTLVISWQRLISQGRTCPRCRSTESELNTAVSQLKQKLAALGIEVVLSKTEITLDEFIKDPTKSNSILFNGRSLEELTGAATGESKCCDVCGDMPCRTVETQGISLETVPADLIVKAGLKAVEVL